MDCGCEGGSYFTYLEDVRWGNTESEGSWIWAESDSNIRVRRAGAELRSSGKAILGIFVQTLCWKQKLVPLKMITRVQLSLCQLKVWVPPFSVLCWAQAENTCRHSDSWARGGENRGERRKRKASVKGILELRGSRVTKNRSHLQFFLFLN